MGASAAQRRVKPDAPPAPIKRSNVRFLEDLLDYLGTADMAATIAEYERLDHESAADDWLIAELGREDLFFLLHRVMHRPDIAHPWLFARCREVEADPYGNLDLWPREHYKSTIITFGCSIQDVLRDCELCTGIFSHSRPKAKDFLRQIKTELETNGDMQALYPEVLWKEPKKAAPKWSEDDGIVVKRANNPQESSFEAWGLVDGMPTGKHFGKLLYDDVVVLESTTTPEMIKKTDTALALSYNLGREGGMRMWVGTRYHYNDTYRRIIENKTAKVRQHVATDDGEPYQGQAGVLFDKETLAKKRRDMGPYIFGTQMMMNPKADDTQGFQREWLRHYKSAQTGRFMNIYLLVDPANSKRKKSDYTSIMVVGLAPDSNYYVLDMVRDRLSLVERTSRVFALHEKWQPIQTRYEEYGMQADGEHIEAEQERRNYRFKIHRVGGNTMVKQDRIRRLIPLYEQGKVWMPQNLHVTTVEGEVRDLVHDYIEEEYAAFPVPVHDDMLDCLSRICEKVGRTATGGKLVDIPLIWPAKRKGWGTPAAVPEPPRDAAMGHMG